VQKSRDSRLCIDAQAAIPAFLRLALLPVAAHLTVKIGLLDERGDATAFASVGRDAGMHHAAYFTHPAANADACIRQYSHCFLHRIALCPMSDRPCSLRNHE
jgi:hypothetical protein